MTVALAPTMPANCRFVVVALFGVLLGDATLVAEGAGTARREPEPSSGTGFARVRFWSPGGLTSIGGSCSADAVCWARAVEMLRQRTGKRKAEASRQMRLRRRFAVAMVADMVMASV